MKCLKASEARRNWFRLLDEVARGELVIIERKGKRIILQKEPETLSELSSQAPDYSQVFQVPDANRADEWGWEWGESGLKPSVKRGGKDNDTSA